MNPWIVHRNSAIESISPETWNKYCKQPLRVFLRDNEASLINIFFNFKASNTYMLSGSQLENSNWELLARKKHVLTVIT